MNREEKWLLKEKYSGMENAEFEADRERLAAGEPLGYVIGHVPFLGCKIYLDSKPLIPRVETEFWVEKAITEINHSSPTAVVKDHHRGPTSVVTTSVVKILDLCAGSGAVGVAVARHAPQAQVTFAEIDKAHLPTIGKNLNENAIACTNYKVFQSDLFTNIIGEFDYILCNPPYVDQKLGRVEESVKKFEPHRALYGGRGGLELIEQIIACLSENARSQAARPAHLSACDAQAGLAPQGELWLEHEPEQTLEIHKLATKSGFTATTHKDQYGVERYSILALQKS